MILVLFNKKENLKKILKRIRNDAEEYTKFYDSSIPFFNTVNIDYCTKPIRSDFVLLDTLPGVPTIRKKIA